MISKKSEDIFSNPVELYKENPKEFNPREEKKSSGRKRPMVLFCEKGIYVLDGGKFKKDKTVREVPVNKEREGTSLKNRRIKKSNEGIREQEELKHAESVFMSRYGKFYE